LYGFLFLLTVKPSEAKKARKKKKSTPGGDNTVSHSNNNSLLISIIYKFNIFLFASIELQLVRKLIFKIIARF
jgi:hypothetical protein